MTILELIAKELGQDPAFKAEVAAVIETIECELDNLLGDWKTPLETTERKLETVS